MEEKTIDGALDLLEAMLTDETFISKYGNLSEYELHSEEAVDSGQGKSTDVWVEVFCADPETLCTEITDNYNDFAQPFEQYAKAHDLYNPKITFTQNSITFKVNI